MIPWPEYPGASPVCRAVPSSRVCDAWQRSRSGTVHRSTDGCGASRHRQIAAVRPVNVRWRQRVDVACPATACMPSRWSGCLLWATGHTRADGPPQLNTIGNDARHLRGVALRRPFLSRSLAISLTAAALLLGSLSIAGSVSAATNIAPTTTCANGMDNTGGLGLICEVTVVNTITATGGRSKTTVRECHGAAGDPTAACQTTVKNLRRLVTDVNQCNDSINGGGGTLRCSVKVTNNFVGSQHRRDRRHREPVRRFGRRHRQRVRSVPGQHDQRHDHPVQRLGQRRHARSAQVHGDWHEALVPRREDQPVQRLGQRRRGPGHLLGQHLEPPDHGGRCCVVRFELRLDADRTADRRRGCERRRRRPARPRSSSWGSP